ncbi:MAG TPA: hypothetical protein VGM37_19825 [Armatimonadota bacterium]|jgi:hypothetical protein
MKRCRTTLALAALLTGHAALAAPALKPAPPPRAGLVGLLERTMSGRPVVSVSYHGDAAALEAPPPREGQELLERLQDISAAASASGPTLIPFLVHKRTWVIAPQTREALNPDLSRLNLADAAPRGLAVDALLSCLTPAQARGLGAPEGISAATLSEEAANAMAAALQPPLRVVEPGAEKGMAPKTILEISEPVDLRQVRLRAYLSNKGVLVPQDQYTATFVGMTPSRFAGSGPRLAESDATRPASRDENGMPITVEAPNALKPSDLPAEQYHQPIGVSGVLTVADVVKRLETVTGLDLTVSAPYQDLPVFIGAPSMPCADVLEGLRLALTAAWRRVGTAYILAWDREPLEAIRQRVREQTDALRRQMARYRDKSWHIDAWLALANALPFDPSDALSPTDDQRARLIPGLDGQWKYTEGIPFEELTPAQQSAMLERMAMVRGPVEEEDARRKGRLTVHADVMLSLRLPGAGWVQAPYSWSYGSVDGANLPVEATKARLRQGEKPPVPASLRDQKPIAWDAPMRGVFVPALSPGRMASLAREMKRAGFNTLFYPLLSNGYSSYSGKAFPKDPALKDEDGLAAAVKAMQAEGIRVIGAVDTLAWQTAAGAHWMKDHRDWLDVDALGRPRLDWLKAFPARNPVWNGLLSANAVRAGEPAVSARLHALVAEAAKRKGIDGIAFAAWRPVQPAPYSASLQPPALGFAMPDRLQWIRRRGLDSADQNGNESNPSSVFTPKPLGRRTAQDSWTAAPVNDDRTDAGYLLADALIRAAKAARPDWKVFLINDSETADFVRYWPALPTPASADAVISTRPADDKAAGLLLPVWPSGAHDPDDSADPWPMDAGLSYAFRASHGELPTRNLQAVLYDFRTAPKEIAETLKWVVRPLLPPNSGGPNR